MKSNVLAAVALWFMGCLNASAMASSDVGVRLRLVESTHVEGGMDADDPSVRRGP